MPDVEIIDIDAHMLGLDRAELQLDVMEHALDDMRPVVDGILHDFERHTRRQFETWGGESGDPWDHLDPSTIAEKQQAGSAFPEWPLVRTGTLMASATGDGPYSRADVQESEASLGIDWERDGWQIPVLHQEGVPERQVTQHRHHKDGTAFTVTYLWHLPARPIFTVTDVLADEGAERIIVYVFNPLAF